MIKTAWTAQAPHFRFIWDSSFPSSLPSSSPYPISGQILPILPLNCPLDIFSPFYWHCSSFTTHYSRLSAGWPTSSVLLPFILHTTSKQVISDHGTWQLRNPPHHLQYKILTYLLDIQSWLPFGPHLFLRLTNSHSRLPTLTPYVLIRL